MSTKIKTSLLDILAGIIALVIINSVSRYIYFDYMSCTIMTALFFLVAGILRGGIQVAPLIIKVLLINVGTLFSFIVVPLPLVLFLPIPFVAIIFTFLGLSVRRKWTSETKNKYTASIIASLVLVAIISFTLYPRYISTMNTHKLNKPASEFEFISFNGDTVRSSVLKGSVIILDFWDSSCGPCRATMPDLEVLYQKYKNHPHVKMFCVDVGWKPLDKEREFVQKQGYTIPFVYDEKSRNEELLGFSGSGFLIMIDTKFTICLRHIGYTRGEDFVGSLSRHIEQYLSEQ